MNRSGTLVVFLCCVGMAVLITIVVRQQETARILAVKAQRIAVAAKVLADDASATCRQTNAARARLNVWGKGFDDFLLTAEQARRATGTPNDIAAADKYGEIAERVKQLPYRDCDADGEPDAPPSLPLRD